MLDDLKNIGVHYSFYNLLHKHLLKTISSDLIVKSDINNVKQLNYTEYTNSRFKYIILLSNLLEKMWHVQQLANCTTLFLVKLKK